MDRGPFFYYGFWRLITKQVEVFNFVYSCVNPMFFHVTNKVSFLNFLFISESAKLFDRLALFRRDNFLLNKVHCQLRLLFFLRLRVVSLSYLLRCWTFAKSRNDSRAFCTITPISSSVCSLAD